VRAVCSRQGRCIVALYGRSSILHQIPPTASAAPQTWTRAPTRLARTARPGGERRARSHCGFVLATTARPLHTGLAKVSGVSIIPEVTMRPDPRYTPPGRYGEDGGESPGTACSRCGPGRVSAGAQSSCVACLSGTHAPAGSAACAACGAGQYAAGAAGACTTCRAGLFDADRDATTPCAACQAGSYAGASIASALRVENAGRDLS
jgi:hypothetical protein